MSLAGDLTSPRDRTFPLAPSGTGRGDVDSSPPTISDLAWAGDGPAKKVTQGGRTPRAKHAHDMRVVHMQMCTRINSPCFLMTVMTDCYT